jgi:hypothetical protein
LEVLDVLLRQATTPSSSAPTVKGTITVIQGGGNTPNPNAGDTLQVLGGGGADSPLVLLGDTARTGRSTGRTPRFTYSGNDIINASAATGGGWWSTGAPATTRSWAAGSTTSWRRAGQATTRSTAVGNDHIYGDDGFNLDLSASLAAANARKSQVLTVATTAVAGDYDNLQAGGDLVEAGDGDDIVLGDTG